MRLAERTLALFLSLVLLGPTVAAQQAHVVDPSALDQALTQSTDEAAAKRQTVLTALRQPQVKEVADRLGLDIARAEAAVTALDGVMLDRLAAQAQQVNDAIAGGQTVRLNILWIILGLLIIILIIVAA
jgi:hypothetical protein